MHNMVKRWVGGNLIQGCLCSFPLLEKRNITKKRKKTENKFDIDGYV